MTIEDDRQPIADLERFHRDRRRRDELAEGYEIGQDELGDDRWLAGEG